MSDNCEITCFWCSAKSKRSLTCPNVRVCFLKSSGTYQISENPGEQYKNVIFIKKIRLVPPGLQVRSRVSLSCPGFSPQRIDFISCLSAGTHFNLDNLSHAHETTAFWCYGSVWLIMDPPANQRKKHQTICQSCTWFHSNKPIFQSIAVFRFGSEWKCTDAQINLCSNDWVDFVFACDVSRVLFRIISRIWMRRHFAFEVSPPRPLNTYLTFAALVCVGGGGLLLNFVRSGAALGNVCFSFDSPDRIYTFDILHLEQNQWNTREFLELCT